MSPRPAICTVFSILVLGACAVNPTEPALDVPRSSLNAEGKDFLLARSQWQVVAIHNGQQTPGDVASGSKLTLAFGVDGRASGQSGCNRFSAAYTQDGRSLRFAQAVGTRMFCGQPEVVMDQEAQMLAALSVVARWRIESDRLVLEAQSGATAMVLVRAVAQDAAP